jgi:hypothetical protein
MKSFKTLSEMYQSKEYYSFISDRLGNDLFINEPERAERINDYAENGCNGSMHSEVIGDWRDYLNTLKVYDPEYDDIEDIEKFDIAQSTYDFIEKEIDSCEDWHEKNGSLHQIIN